MLLASDSAEAALAETLVGTRLQPQTRYTLSVAVFDRDSRNAAQQDVVAFPRRVSLQLLAGTTVLKSMSGPSANGGGRLWSLEYDSPAENLPPDDLTIVLGAAGFAAEGAVNAQVVFDDVSLSAGPLGTTREADPRELAFFESRIRPVLAQHCLKCHSGGKPKGGLVDHRDGWRQGGDSGRRLRRASPTKACCWPRCGTKTSRCHPRAVCPTTWCRTLPPGSSTGRSIRAPLPRWPRSRPTPLGKMSSKSVSAGGACNPWSSRPCPRSPFAIGRGEVDHFILAAIEARQLARPPRPITARLAGGSAFAAGLAANGRGARASGRRSVAKRL